MQNFTYLANGVLILGRGPDCAVLLDGTGISREHTAIEWEDSVLFVTDLSTNGTWVNGKRIGSNRKCKVDEGDSIELPGYEIRYRIAGHGAAAPAAKPAVKPVPSAGESQHPLSMPGSFTLSELFLILVALAAFSLLLVYWNS